MAWSKRIVDVVGGSVLALLALPLVAVLAVVLAVTFRAWPFFVQERIGFGGRRLRIVKLRTLWPGTGPYLLKGELPPDAAPPLARALRRWHLDELPQLLLVPLGRLSLVGPRPKMPDRFEPVEAGYGAQRVVVPQGCTGLWQIGRHAHLLPSEAPQYDLFYVAHASLRLDLWILWRTALLLGGLAPAASLGDVPHWATSPVGAPRPEQVTEVPSMSRTAA